MSIFREIRERKPTSTGQPSKRFDLLQQKANLVDTSLSAMKKRDEIVAPVDRIKQFTDQNVAKLRQLARNTRMNRGMDGHTMSFLTPREEADFRNAQHSRESHRKKEQEFAKQLHKNIVQWKNQELSDDVIETNAKNFRDNNNKIENALNECFNHEGQLTKENLKCIIEGYSINSKEDAQSAYDRVIAIKRTDSNKRRRSRLFEILAELGAKDSLPHPD